MMNTDEYFTIWREWGSAFHLLRQGPDGGVSGIDSSPETRSQVNYFADFLRDRGFNNAVGRDIGGDNQPIDWRISYINPHAPGTIQRYTIADLMKEAHNDSL